jgi:hypothetical protein
MEPASLQIHCGSEACGNMCGNVTSTTTGVVQSPDFPGDYGNYNKKCYVIITAPAGWMIQLKFTDFNVESNVCSVYVKKINRISILLVDPNSFALVRLPIM